MQLFCRSLKCAGFVSEQFESFVRFVWGFVMRQFDNFIGVALHQQSKEECETISVKSCKKTTNEKKY